MDIFDLLTLIGGLCLFLFGMNVMGSALEKRAGGRLKDLLGKLTSNRFAGLLMGLAVTSVIQSSSATTVMVVGFVNSGLMTLKQAINVIMGANIGTTVTAWLLSLTGIQGDNIFVRLLKPSAFTPILALIGIIMYMMSKSGKKKDTGLIFLGFATLMFGMETMSSAVSGLSDVPGFRNILLMFSNPILGVLAGALLTAIIQSSSASVGILQALSSTGQITFGTSIPIIMGQNIGTCVTALISSVGTNKNAKRAAAVHLFFNIIGTIVWLSVFCLLNWIFKFDFVNQNTDQLGIAIVHSVFNILCTLLLFPLTGVLEKLAHIIIKDSKSEEHIIELDERLLSTPSVAIDQCRSVAGHMASDAVTSMVLALASLQEYKAEAAPQIREYEQTVDHYEDIIGSYLVKISSRSMSDADSAESAKLLHIIGDFERISDHSVNILESAEELRDKGISFSDEAKRELSILIRAVNEIMELSLTAFLKDDLKSASLVEPLEQVIDSIKEQLRTRHIQRLQKGTCTIEVGFVLSDILTDLERVADHCSNIAGCVIEMSKSSLDLHEYLREIRTDDPAFISNYNKYTEKYSLA